MLIAYFILGIILSTVFALLEIQIEGKNGWAGQLPTWKLYKPWFKYIPGGNKPLTGYHTFLWMLMFLYPHVTFLLTPWDIEKEIILISFVLLVLRLEDFLWVVLNPSYGIKKFKKEFLPWHSQWLGPAPVQYYTSIITWLLLLILGLSLFKTHSNVTF